MTMVKANVNDEANEYINHIRDSHENMNKSDALAYIVEEQARDWEQHDANQ